MKFEIFFEITGKAEVEAEDELEAKDKFDMMSIDEILDEWANPLEIIDIGIKEQSP